MQQKHSGNECLGRAQEAVKVAAGTGAGDRMAALAMHVLGQRRCACAGRSLLPGPALTRGSAASCSLYRVGNSRAAGCSRIRAPLWAMAHHPVCSVHLNKPCADRSSQTPVYGRGRCRTPRRPCTHRRRYHPHAALLESALACMSGRMHAASATTAKPPAARGAAARSAGRRRATAAGPRARSRCRPRTAPAHPTTPWHLSVSLRPWAGARAQLLPAVPAAAGRAAGAAGHTQLQRAPPCRGSDLA